MEFDNLLQHVNTWLDSAAQVLVEVDTYSQLGIIIIAYVIAYLLSNQIRQKTPMFKAPIDSGSPHPIKAFFYRVGKLLFPIIAIMLLRLGEEFIGFVVEDSWLMKTAIVVASLLLLNSFIALVITNPVAATAFRVIGLPLLFFHLIGLLDNIIKALESISITLGNIELSAYGLIRVLIFGSLLFWLGRISNSTGQNIIRRQKSLDIRTREVFAKLFEIAVFFVVFLLILQVMGINLTTLAVFGGALGVGLGFGLQAIASNFISGVIILLDRSITVGDYIELEDGRAGTVTELNMRSTTLETYDGKDIVVPNEKFITTSFTNWTHKNFKQRYRVDFSVAYNTDIRTMCGIIKELVATHPLVISGHNSPVEEWPDCEIDSFGDSGVNMFVEFWMEGIDDGKNRVASDLLLMIFECLREHKIEIPFPQREVRVLNAEDMPAPGSI